MDGSRSRAGYTAHCHCSLLGLSGVTPPLCPGSSLTHLILAAKVCLILLKASPAMDKTPRTGWESCLAVPPSLHDGDIRSVSLSLPAPSSSAMAHAKPKAKAVPPHPQLISRLLHEIPLKEHRLPLLRVAAAQGGLPNARQMASPRKMLWSEGKCTTNIPQQD